MELRNFIREAESPDLTLRVVNRTELDPVYGMLEDAFEGQDVAVEEASSPDASDDGVVLCEAGEAVAVSSLIDVRDSVLTVNSDLYITGSRPLEEVDTPDVIAELGDTTFTVADRQKFLLVQMSREIESMALAADGGRLHSGFQYLSRLDDERGTLAAYERLADAAVDVHVYGVPDARPMDRPGVELHGLDADEIRSSWFVVFGGDSETVREAALVAHETSPNTWNGLWTFDTELVERIERHLRSAYL